ncbi:type II toxin-antitoxin system prevent-host-death family antitoxin [Candidatus Binatia bacterium]|nr:type II toxin-antitoxin system prevent-host-death family antitoxin [Candidatus Binatia bacterium]
MALERTERVTTLERQATVPSDIERSKEPIVITQHVLPSAYLVDVESYEAMQRRLTTTWDPAHAHGRATPKPTSRPSVTELVRRQRIFLAFGPAKTRSRPARVFATDRVQQFRVGETPTRVQSPGFENGWAPTLRWVDLDVEELEF